MRSFLSMVMVLLAFHATLLASFPAFAQQTAAPAQGADVVFLKHGGEIRGTLTELRAGDHATVQLGTGQVATIRWDEIDRLERNGQPMQLPGSTPAPAPLPYSSGTPATPPPATGARPVAAGSAPAKPAAYAGPETMAYDSDYGVPAGYHVEKKLKLGLLITGAILTGIGLAGITAIQLSDGNSNAKAGASVAVGVLFLGPGLPLFLVGLFARSKYLVRDDLGEAKLRLGPLPPMTLGVQPHTTGGGGSFVLSGSF